MKLMRIMGYKNFGFAKAIVSNKLGNEFLNEGEVKSKDLARTFLEVIKESELLQQEFKIFETIENKHIANDALATRYIDETIKLFENFTKQEMLDAHENLSQFIDETFIDLDPKKKELYEAIDVLLYEKAKGGNPDIDAIHEAFETVLEYIKSNVPTANEDNTFTLIDESLNLEDVVHKSIEKFNQKYSTLNENQRTVLNKLVFGNDKEKKELFESLKEENINILSQINKNGIEDKINESISRISKMEFNQDTLVKDIVSLCDLKSNLS